MSGERIQVELSKDQLLAAIGAISYAAACDDSFKYHTDTLAAYKAFQHGLRELIGVPHPPLASLPEEER